MQILEDHYLYLGSPERQVACDLRFKIRGDGRLYLAYLKTESYVQGAGVFDIWQVPLPLKCATQPEICGLL